MRVVDRRIIYSSKSDTFHIIPIGDIHIGNVNSDKKALIKLVDWIKTCDKCLWLGMGDYIDIIPANDKRHNIYEADRVFKYNNRVYELYDPQEQYRLVRDIFKPIKDKCLGILTGNHELKYENYGANFARLLARDLEAPT